MKRYRIRFEGQTFDVAVLDNPRLQRVRVEVNGEIFTVEVENLLAGTEEVGVETTPHTSSPSVISSPVPSASLVTAPLPGVVKAIAVRPGQRVRPDDELLVIEAMKMDNVIRAQREGVIGAIHVTEGRQVAYGDPLLEFAG